MSVGQATSRLDDGDSLPVRPVTSTRGLVRTLSVADREQLARALWDLSASQPPGAARVVVGRLAATFDPTERKTW